ncbi:hypothetical protein L873DRAFT_629362 [Choiromyces venosus 120613-1]|uniref:Uncharacterized protein n=1 Tax=Choiromyces venosus 120613-1 TaxID=1336337 RepID=A0A3N4JTN0_9PEZI|nr:hypothetical protein L873DRAFT_629362 [Choiromyces venosus 120613-1]
MLTPLLQSSVHPNTPHILNHLSLYYICNDDQSRILEHRIYNVDETPLPWEYLIGCT